MPAKNDENTACLSSRLESEICTKTINIVLFANISTVIPYNSAFCLCVFFCFLIFPFFSPFFFFFVFVTRNCKHTIELRSN